MAFVGVGNSVSVGRTCTGMTLREITKFLLISWCEYFVETLWKMRVSSNFHTKKLDEITVFYAA